MSSPPRTLHQSGFHTGQPLKENTFRNLKTFWNTNFFWKPGTYKHNLRNFAIFATPGDGWFPALSDRKDIMEAGGWQQIVSQGLSLRKASLCAQVDEVDSLVWRSCQISRAFWPQMIRGEGGRAKYFKLSVQDERNYKNIKSIPKGFCTNLFDSVLFLYSSHQYTTNILVQLQLTIL